MSGSVIRLADGKFAAVNDEPAEVARTLNTSDETIVEFESKIGPVFVNVDQVCQVHRYVPRAELERS